MKRIRPLVGDVRGKGLIIGIELVRNHETKNPAAEEAALIRDTCRKKGVLMGHGGVKGNVVRFQPPLVITKEEIDHAISVLNESIEEVEKNIT
jgi:4-aminobutyrate aminotransferase-like enzyme